MTEENTEGGWTVKTTRPGTRSNNPFKTPATQNQYESLQDEEDKDSTPVPVQTPQMTDFTPTSPTAPPGPLTKTPPTAPPEPPT